MIKLLALAALLLQTGGASLDAASWSALSESQRMLIGIVMPAAGPDPWKPDDLRSFVLQRGTRGSGYLAIGFLMRNEGADRENARAVLDLLLGVQYDRPGDPMHGVWSTSVDTTRDRRDLNWREFVGTALIVARKTFPDELGQDRVARIDAAIQRAAVGAAARDVNPGYTNIALMSSLLMDTAGHLEPDSGLREKGVAKARAIYEMFSQHDTFLEYNSPTYYGADLMALAMWREVADSPELRAWGSDMEQKLWRDIGQFYHAGFQTMCGPHVRAYGMDMKRYTALTGLAITLVTDDPAIAPIPGPDGKRVMHEWAYTVVYALLGLPVPEDVFPHLERFLEPRRLTRQVVYRGKTYTISASLHEDWMMGASNGMIRAWEQHYPATIHWRAPDGGTSWLLVHGSSGVAATIVDGAISVTMPRRKPARPLRLFLDPAGLDLDRITGTRWKLPGFTIDAQTPLGTPTVSRIHDDRLGEVIEVSWPVPDSLPSEATILTLRPIPPGGP